MTTTVVAANRELARPILQLTGNRRLSDALAGCDEKGWDALPLAEKEMARLFPRQRRPPNAGSAKTPGAYRDLIRVPANCVAFKGRRDECLNRTAEIGAAVGSDRVR